MISLSECRAVVVSLGCALGLLLVADPLQAQGNAVVGDMQAGAALPGGAGRIGLLPGWREADGRHVGGLVVTLAPGWKTYWRAPGEAGIPPVFDWSGSRNLARVAIHWPRPIVFDQAGMTSIGYAEELVLPLEIVPNDPAAPVGLDVELTLGVCRDICVPVTARFAARLDGPGAADARIQAALDRQPGALRGAVTCRVAPIADGLRLEAMLPSDWPAVEAVAVEVPDATVWVSQAEVSRSGDRVMATVDLVPSSGAPFALDRSSLRFTMFGGGDAVEARGCTGG